VKADGSVACWGEDAARPAAGTFTQVSVGYNHGCGVKADGSLACWGPMTTAKRRRQQGRSPRSPQVKATPSLSPPLARFWNGALWPASRSDLGPLIATSRRATIAAPLRPPGCTGDGHLCYANAMGSTIGRDIRTVPNVITLSRILLVLLGVWCTSTFLPVGASCCRLWRA